MGVDDIFSSNCCLWRLLVFSLNYGLLAFGLLNSLFSGALSL